MIHIFAWSVWEVFWNLQFEKINWILCEFPISRLDRGFISPSLQYMSEGTVIFILFLKLMMIHMFENLEKYIYKKILVHHFAKIIFCFKNMQFFLEIGHVGCKKI